MTNRRFTWAMRLVLAGLVVQVLSLFGLYHPWGFMLFAAVGCTLAGAGVILFLLSILSTSESRPSE